MIRDANTLDVVPAVPDTIEEALEFSRKILSWGQSRLVSQRRITKTYFDQGRSLERGIDGYALLSGDSEHPPR